MVRWSIAVGILGACVTASAMVYLRRGMGLEKRSEPYWILGVAALFPGWLIALLRLLDQGSIDSPQFSLPRSVILSSGIALIGVILSDFAARRLRGSGKLPSPAAYWLLGVLSLLPAWGLALWSLLLGG